MKKQDREHLNARLKKLGEIIKAEHAKRKEDRDENAIAEARVAIKNINEWLAEPKQRAGSSDPKVMPKKMFRQKFNEAFNLEEPTEQIVIDTIEELHKVWPKIAGSNIQVSAPKEVQAEIRKLIKGEVKHIKIKGFR